MKQSFILERWAMFFIFYFYFNEKILKEFAKQVKRLVQKVRDNSGLIIGTWGLWIQTTDSSSLKKLGGRMASVGDACFQSLSTVSPYRNIFEIVENNNKSIMKIFDTW